jgi:hypothetical protein
MLNVERIRRDLVWLLMSYGFGDVLTRTVVAEAEYAFEHHGPLTVDAFKAKWADFLTRERAHLEED